MDKKEILDLKQNIDLLLAGIDPQSSISFGEDSVLKSDYNREILNKISIILEYLLMCDKEAIEVQKILPFLSDTWPLCRIGRAVI
ncbi:MAG: hypothetical protein SOY48_03440, partial [Eubacterium sp.]|nr:hypothetical protein [Eubacterium sp.]